MNILLVSQCDKRALTQTRRILDQFAERKGDCTWQTPITRAGLDTLRTLLRQSARKNTSVACHWIRSKNHTELMWIVGDASRFNHNGATPTNTTTRDVLRGESENTWANGELIHLMAALASLLHDIGKACDAFQSKLTGGSLEKNLYRHEWISLRLFQSFVGKVDPAEGHTKANDLQWLQRIVDAEHELPSQWTASWQNKTLFDDPKDAATTNFPLQELKSAPLACAIGWLVVSHHFIPQHRELAKGKLTQSNLSQWFTQCDPTWNNGGSDEPNANAKKYWTFGKGLPVAHPHWRKDAARIARRLIKLIELPQPSGDPLTDPFVMHVSRMSLMLADHYYSSLNKKEDRIKISEPSDAYANTHEGERNQFLEEHLIGVAQNSRLVTWALPNLRATLTHTARHKLLQKRSTEAQYKWQNKAFEAAEAMRPASLTQGAFCVNMASTGCGKTLANAKVMYALADPERGMRCAFAMGLRTLTLQTGRQFQQLLAMTDEQVAVRVGDSATRELFKKEAEAAEKSGSESRLDLLDEASSVEYEGNLDTHPVFSKLLHERNVSALLMAPLLVCTIDHLTPATEGTRGGRQIAPMLRLMSGDLVLDEPDEFDLTDLPALARLVNWAGLLGARVLLSSATLPPSLVQGLFESYRAGRRFYNKNCVQNARDDHLNIPCLWIDEFGVAQAHCTDVPAFVSHHVAFAKARDATLAKQVPRRRYEIQPLTITRKRDPEEEFAQHALKAALSLHANHHIDTADGKKISFGLIRMANITPLYKVARAIYKSVLPEDTCIHLCTYHSNFPLIQRSNIESQLDSVLNRRPRKGNTADPALGDPAVLRALAGRTEKNHLFIVLGSPVTEIGRDHDYDWAVVEPSSLRSLIQLFGRVRRHRDGACTSTNIIVFNRNLKVIRGGNTPHYWRPGFEGDKDQYAFSDHDLETLLEGVDPHILDARPRIIAVDAEHAKPNERFADMEHLRLHDTVMDIAKLNARAWWDENGPMAQLCAQLQALYPFRDDGGQREVRLCFQTIGDDEDADLQLARIDQIGYGKRRNQTTHSPITKTLFTRISAQDLVSAQVKPWLHAPIEALVRDLAETRDEPVSSVARRFTQMTVRDNNGKGWYFSDYLGLSSRKL
jgi:CRISPR-associated endonuclease/helicase Cas3